MTIIWDENWSVGNRVIDSQHQKLIELVNRAESLARQTGPDIDDRFLKLLAEVSAYIKEHFAAEEQLLMLVKYKGLHDQIREHDALNQRLSDFMQAVTEVKGGEGDRLQFAQMMAGWLENHVLIEDMKFKSELI